MRKLTNEPDHLALWQHPVYGARTLENIREMDNLPRPKQTARLLLPPDNYSVKEDRFIDENGFSSARF